MRPSKALAWVAPLAALAAVTVFSDIGRDRNLAVIGSEGVPRHSGPPPMVAPHQMSVPFDQRVPADEAKTNEGVVIPERSDVVENPLRERTASIVVRAISGQTGDPVVGLGVTLTGLRPQDLRRGTTDGAGMVAFEELRAGRKTVSGALAGMTSFTLDTGERRTVDLVLPEGVAVRVRVTNRADAPIARASVLLSSHPSATFGEPVATTGWNGECGLTGVELGRNIWVEAEGYETSYAQPITHGGDVAVVLGNEGWSLTGRVVGADTGEGLSAARVWVEGYTTPGSVTQPDGSTLVYLPPPSPTSATDTRGEFRVSVSDSTSLALVASAEGYATRQVPLTPAALASNPLVVVLDPSPGLFGFVRDIHDGPVADAQLEVHAECLTVPLMSQAEEDGSFCVLGVPAGEVVVRARAAGGYTGELTAIASAHRENNVVVVVSTAGSILVRVRTINGEPISGCTLVRVMESAGPTSFLTLRYIGRTDEGGMCRIARMRLEAGATIGFVLPNVEPSFPFGQTHWSGGESELEIDLVSIPDPGTLRFSCGPNSSESISSTLSLFLRANDTGPWLGRTTDEQGFCSYEGLPPGPYRAIASLESIEYDLGLWDIRPGEVRVVTFDLRNRNTFPQTSLAEQR